MRFAEFYASQQPVISFELFPPKTDGGMSKLEQRIPKLIALEPSFMTVTYGALGSTRERTLELVSRIKNVHGMEVGHHLTCVGATGDDIEELLKSIRRENVENIVALRGDPPQGENEFRPPEGGYGHADELVAHIQRFGGFGVAVAGYPEKHIEAPDFESDLEYLKGKIDLGADVVITQLFYDNRFFYEFQERCRAAGITKPIIPGLLPILSLEQIKRITGICGASLPETLMDRLVAAGGDETRVHQVGIEHTVGQVLDLLEQGVAGIHFYVLNQYFHIAEIMVRIQPALKKIRDLRVGK